jgi:hypothetical protein
MLFVEDFFAPGARLRIDVLETCEQAALEEAHFYRNYIHLFTMARKESINGLESVGRQLVVRIEEVNVLTPGQLDTFVAADTNTGMLLFDKLYIARVLLLVLLTHRGTAVSTAVVNQYNLDIIRKADRLLHYALDRFAQVVLGIVERDDYRKYKFVRTLSHS